MKMVTKVKERGRKNGTHKKNGGEKKNGKTQKMERENIKKGKKGGKEGKAG